MAAETKASDHKIVIIGEIHDQVPDDEFTERAKIRAKNKEIVVVLENFYIDQFKAGVPFSEGEMSRNLYASEDETLSFYAELISKSFRLHKIPEAAHYELWLKHIGEYIVDDLYNKRLVESFESGKIETIIYQSLRQTLPEFIPIVSVPKKAAPLTNKEIKEKLPQIHILFKKIAENICSSINQESSGYSESIKRHPAVHRDWVDNFFKFRVIEPDFYLAPLYLRNQFFADFLIKIFKKYPNKAVWFICGNKHLEDLRRKITGQDSGIVVETVDRDKKWPLVAMEEPKEESKEVPKKANTLQSISTTHPSVASTLSNFAAPPTSSATATSPNFSSSSSSSSSDSSRPSSEHQTVPGGTLASKVDPLLHSTSIPPKSPGRHSVLHSSTSIATEKDPLLENSKDSKRDYCSDTKCIIL